LQIYKFLDLIKFKIPTLKILNSKPPAAPLYLLLSSKIISLRQIFQSEPFKISSGPRINFNRKRELAEF